RHDGGCDRNPALLLHLHPVRACAPPVALGLHHPGHLDRSPEQQKLLRQRRLARIRVRNDRERPPLLDRILEIHDRRFQTAKLKARPVGPRLLKNSVRPRTYPEPSARPSRYRARHRPSYWNTRRQTRPWQTNTPASEPFSYGFPFFKKR